MIGGITITFSGRLAQDPRELEGGTDGGCELIVLMLATRSGRNGNYSQPLMRRAVTYDPQIVAQILGEEGYKMHDSVVIVADDMSNPSHRTENGRCQIQQPTFHISSVNRISDAFPAGDPVRAAEASVLAGVS